MTRHNDSCTHFFITFIMQPRRFWLLRAAEWLAGKANGVTLAERVTPQYHYQRRRPDRNKPT